VLALSKWNQVLHAVPKEKALQMVDALRGTEMLGTDIRAIKFHVTPVDPLFVGNLLEPPSRQIPGVGDQTEDSIQTHGPDIVWIPVHHRTGGNTRAAGNAFRV
jgi:hypothetical protein